jgi:hypothetical protein
MPANQQAAYLEERWRMSDEWSKESNRQAADHVYVKLRSVGKRPDEVIAQGFTEGQVAKLARMEHKRWCAERLLNGWRPLPPTDENLTLWDDDGRQKAFKAEKLHIDLVPFDDLIKGEPDKDYQQIEAIPHALHAAQSRCQHGTRHAGRKPNDP